MRKTQWGRLVRFLSLVLVKMKKNWIKISGTIAFIGIVIAIIANFTKILDYFGIKPTVDPNSTAEHLYDCVNIHKMNNLNEAIEVIKEMVDFSNVPVTIHKSCEWPPSDFSDKTGYSEVITTSVPSPESLQGNLSMAEINYFKIVRIFSDCNVEVTLNFGLQGAYYVMKPITLKKGSHVNYFGETIIYTNDPQGIYLEPQETGFPLEDDETDLFLTRGQSLNDIKCTSELIPFPKKSPH